MVALNEEAEISRSVVEIRAALGALARAGKLAYPLMFVGPLIDRARIGTTKEAGESSFVLDDETGVILFRETLVSKVYKAALDLADEFGFAEGSEEAIRVAQNAVNLLVIHELEHIHQNFPDFAHVQEVKAGMPVYGLPILDVAADTVAAWACANVECQRLGANEEEDLLRQFVNMLILTYVIGALVFEVRGRAEKMQRALGLVTAAVLIQAKIDNLLDQRFIFQEWTPLSPLLAMNLAATPVFNILVIDKVPGLLLKSNSLNAQQSVVDLWDSVGTSPVSRTRELTALALRTAGAIKTYAANEDAPEASQASHRKPSAKSDGFGLPE